MNKIVYYILDFVILILSYMLCDYIADKVNIVFGIFVGISSYIIVYFILRKIFKIKK